MLLISDMISNCQDIMSGFNNFLHSLFHIVAVPLFETCYVFWFEAYFQIPSGLIAGDSDHLCAGGETVS